ncbi:peptidyl-prolyl cis-trans isomerase [Paenibacillus sp. SAFN-054]
MKIAMRIIPVKRWKQLGILLSSCCLLAAAAAGYAFARDGETANGPVMTVNGEEVTAEEFESFMSRERLDTIGYFQTRYGAAYDASFWRRSYEGQTPLEELRQRAMDQLVRTKVQQIAAKREGLTDNISYEALMLEREEENRRREADVRAGRVIYGPEQYGVEEYEQYAFSRLRTGLLERLASGELSPAPSEIDAYYRENRDELYQAAPTVRVIKLLVSGRTASSLQQAELAARQGKSLSSLRADGISADHGMKLSEQVFDERSLRDDSRYEPELLTAAQHLQPGERSGVVPVAEGYAILECLERSGGGYVPLPQVEADIRSRLLEHKYEAWLEAQIRQAKVELNEDEFEKLEIRD